MKKAFAVVFICFLILSARAQTKETILPVPSDAPSSGQKEQIKRKYGMFIHFGINTFHNQEWTDGSKPASSYNPSKIDAKQWVRSAKEAGMRYIILVAKHHDGFCLWDSKYTEYDVASSPNKTNVIEEAAKACKKYGIGLGIYYSLWDRKENPNVNNQNEDLRYNKYMLNQLEEIIEIAASHTDIIEFWFDGGWVKQNYRWPIMDIYQLVKSKMPKCQIGVNWTIGTPQNADERCLPKDQKEGYPIRYFPSDFRLGDPLLPAENDPKIFTYGKNRYYMPWESTVCLSGKWFYHTEDNAFKSIEELEKIFLKATANDNILILNCPPNRDGRLRDKDVEILKELRKRISDKL